MLQGPSGTNPSLPPTITCLLPCTLLLLGHAAAGKVVDKHSRNPAKYFTSDVVEAAKSTAICDIVEREATIRDIEIDAIETTTLQLHPSFLARLREQIARVTVDMVVEAVRRWLAPLTDAVRSASLVAVPLSQGRHCAKRVTAAGWPSVELCTPSPTFPLGLQPVALDIDEAMSGPLTGAAPSPQTQSHSPDVSGAALQQHGAKGKRELRSEESATGGSWFRSKAAAIASAVGLATAVGVVALARRKH